MKIDLHCNANPVKYVDPDGRNWYEAEDGEITWTDFTSQKDLDDNIPNILIQSEVIKKE